MSVKLFKGTRAVNGWAFIVLTETGKWLNFVCKDIETGMNWVKEQHQIQVVQKGDDL